MLTEIEKELLEDQEGPLGGGLLFDTVWRGNGELEQAFLEFCITHRPARYIDWSREMKPVTQLELSTRDMGETVAAFLAYISTASPQLFPEAINSLKSALGTNDVPIPEIKPIAREKDLLRLVHSEADRLMKAHKLGKPYPVESLRALHLTLQEFEDPPVDAHQFKALTQMFTDIEDLIKTPSKVGVIAHYIHFNLPYHEPVLREFARWCEDPNRPQHEVIEVGTSDWVPRLESLELVDRRHAIETMRQVITSPELQGHLNEFLQALQVD